jgi:hypothetical protein
MERIRHLPVPFAEDIHDADFACHPLAAFPHVFRRAWRHRGAGAATPGPGDETPIACTVPGAGEFGMLYDHP